MAFTCRDEPLSNKHILQLAHGFNPAWSRIDASHIKTVQNLDIATVFPHYGNHEESMDKRNNMEQIDHERLNNLKL